MQKETCDAVLKGYNVMILGQGGTGKSFLLSIIKKELTKLGKSVSITGSTGVASLKVDGITIHAWSGIGDGHFSNEQLVTKIFFSFFLITNCIALIAVNNLLDIQLLPSIPSC